MRATKVITAAGVALVVAGAGAAWIVSRPEPQPPATRVPAFATVTLHGRDGTFGSLGTTAPSGQAATQAAVPGWDFAPGVQAYRSALAADGTVLVAGASHKTDFSAPTADRATVAAYRPAAGTFATIQIGPVRSGAPSVADLEPVDGGVAFVTRPARDAPLDGWPAFGLLTTVEGQWRVAPVGGAVHGGDFNDLATLPRSRHILVARAGRQGKANGGLLAVRLSGPDREGRFTAEVTAEYRYPRVRDGQVSVREVRVDPTGSGGAERFAIGLDVDRGEGKFYHQLVQEFRYDAAKEQIAPVSAPVIPGDRNDDGKGAFFEYNSFLYDHAGNLWVSRSDGFRGGPLAVYTAADGRRRLASGDCRLRPGQPLDRLRAVAGARRAWGKPCPPDYDILQPRHLLAIIGLAQDPASKDVVALAFGGTLLAVRAVPTGGGLAFQVGNPVDLGRKLLPIVDTAFPQHRLGPVDSAHRAWVTGMHAARTEAGQHLDQWMYSVDTTDLFDPAPVVLPATPGRAVTIQAERSSIVTTTVRPGRGSAAHEVVSDVTVQDCGATADGTTCGYDQTPGDGFVIADETRFGHLRGDVDYRVEVPAAGRYQVSYRAATFPVTKTARIALSAGGRTYTQPVNTNGHWTTVRATEAVTLPAGPQTIRLSPPEGRGGWFLNSFTLQRL
ncbi:hypothetical protein ACTMTJ_26770 [Phytohabitans sp. LJ34]|uniref:hypothetical protein n=1 Tax=Phytohabitans sp. LJ34 TaxID=3452217 RepID=UPI003F89B746